MHEYRIFSGRNENSLERFECDVPAPTAREVIQTNSLSRPVPPWTACSRQRVSRNPQRLDPSKRIR
jgi:hypothetical protein